MYLSIMYATTIIRVSVKHVYARFETRCAGIALGHGKYIFSRHLRVRGYQLVRSKMYVYI